MSDAIDRAQEREQFDREMALAEHHKHSIDGLATVSVTDCIECSAEIPEARRRAVPGVQLCVDCQTTHERKEKLFK